MQARTWTLRGMVVAGSHLEDQDLRKLIRELLAEGRLPKQPPGGIQERAGGLKPCAACGEVIQAWSGSYVLQFFEGPIARNLAMHHRCFNVWERELMLYA